jgi:hypothetical protein
VNPYEESVKGKARYRTRLRTIRLPVSIDAALEEEAAKRGITMNSFVVSILERYEEWDRLAEKFRFVGFPMQLVREEFSLVEDQGALRRMGHDFGAKVPREMMLFWFKEVNVESFLKYLALQSKYQGYAEYETIHRNDRIVIIAKHLLGPSWSVWLGAYLEEAVKSNLDVAPRVEVTDNTVKLEFEKR